MKKSLTYEDKLQRLSEWVSSAKAIVIGAGAGLSTSAGFTYSGKRFDDNFADFKRKYGFKDMYSAGFYPYGSLEEYWAYWSRYVFINRYQNPTKPVYDRLLKAVNGKNYFVITTNVDHCFQKAGFDKKRLFYTQGDYGLFQCSAACHDKTYDNEDIIKKMVNKQRDMKIPSELIPYCPVCGRPMTMNLRSDDKFVQDSGWYKAFNNYESFIEKYKTSNILYFELGIGRNTPAIIKYQFWRLTASNPQAKYVCINFGEADCPKEIEDQAICFENDIGEVLGQMRI